MEERKEEIKDINKLKAKVIGKFSKQKNGEEENNNGEKKNERVSN